MVRKGDSLPQGSPTGPPTRQEIRGSVRRVIPVDGKTRGRQVAIRGYSVAEIGVNIAGCHTTANNPIPVLLPPLQDSLSYES